MKAYGSAAIRAHSSRDGGLPLPAATRSGRTIFDDLERLQAARDRLSPVQVQPLTADQLTALETAPRKPRQARPRKAPVKAGRGGLTRAQITTITGLARVGRSIPQIAAQTGSKPETVQKYLDLEGVPRPDGRAISAALRYPSPQSGPRKTATPQPRRAAL